MGAWLRSWWQQIQKYRLTILVVAIVLVIAIAIIIIGYQFDWTGFGGYNKVTTTHIISGTNAGTITRTEEYQPGKSIWDWLQLLGVLAIPVVVGFGAIWFTSQQGKVADEENKDNQRETALQSYIDSMSELLLHEKLRESGEEDEVRKIARVRTLTVLPRLDKGRKKSVLQFLHESGLIEKGKNIINLSGADLSDANLSGANLSGAGLSRADLSRAWLFRANLSGADLSRADLSRADLQFADLSGANLHGASLRGPYPRGADPLGPHVSRANLLRANLRGANLSEVNVTAVQLDKAKSLQGATMPDGSIHD